VKLIAVNVATPASVEVPGGTVLTSIFKSPVEGRLAVRGHNIDGDRQADLTVHGGPYKAVYCYPGEHYDYWRDRLPHVQFTSAMFGENLTTEGLNEETVHIGDHFRIGSVVLQVTQPRMPCYKLGIRFGMPEIVKLFWMSGRPGIYFSVVEEGELGAGDSIEKLAEEPDGVSVADVVALYRGVKSDQALLDRALRSPLAGGWKQGLRERRGG
jgi:MOSC domain-containing protein YiiM